MIWKNKKIYFIGIKGTGISGLAVLLQGEGAAVSGSDTAEEFPSEAALKKAGIKIRLFDEKNIIPGLNLVIYSSAYPAGHPERKKAAELGIPELSYAEALAEYARGKKTIVVTGTHGKTTTAALLGVVFETAGLDPAVLAGDIVKNWGSSVRTGRGEHFIVEGDEYQEKFRLFKPDGIVIPALDWDHPDYFPTREAYLKSFEDWFSENPRAKLVRAWEQEDERIFRKAKFVLPGRKYRENCLLAIRLCRLFGISEEKIVSGINNFKGVGRRLDYYSDWIVYDYAHHPEEIKATLDALHERHPDKSLIAVFQPHTYSRTKIFLKEFAQAFERAELVFFEKIYASARESASRRSGKIGIEDLIRETRKFHKKVFSFEDFSLEKLSANSLLVFMGAGDIWQKARKLASLLGGKERNPD